MANAPRPRLAALALAVGLVLADSSVVVLALPEIVVLTTDNELIVV